jgi:hypothetical protein
VENNEVLLRQYAMLKCLAGLPKKMISLHGADNITEFVLHDLCHTDCFNLSKVAYFIDNPDFDHTKGIAGFSRSESDDCKKVWEQPDDFSARMKNAAFNQQVRNVSRLSSYKNNYSLETVAQELAKDLNFKNYGSYSWQLKHDNHGVVLFEKVNASDTVADEYLLNGLSLLGFCPVF